MYESGEDYLEAILVLKNKNGFVRSVDIANHLGFSKPSVSRAMGILERDGYIEFGLGNMIQLTEKGLEKANDIYGRHQLLTKFLVMVTGPLLWGCAYCGAAVICGWMTCGWAVICGCGVGCASSCVQLRESVPGS